MQIIAEAKKRGEEKAKKTKSMIVLDVKPWDDTTGTLGGASCHAVRQGRYAAHSMLLMQCMPVAM